jgi:hypothetical protein
MINYTSIMLDMCITSKIFGIYATYLELAVFRLFRCSIGHQSDFFYLKTNIDIGTEADFFCIRS